MKRLTLSVIFLALGTLLSAQKGKTSTTLSNPYQGKEISIAVERSIPLNQEVSFLTSELGLNENFSLQLDKSIESITAIHNHYQLTFKGQPIFNGKVHTVRLKSNGQLQRVIHNNTPLNVSEDLVNFPNTQAKLLKDRYNAEQILHDEVLWLPLNGQLVPARSTEVMSEGTALLKEIIYTDNGTQFELDHVKHHHASGPNDTTISVYVFEPDPLTTAGVNYSGSYVDNNDAAVPVLENEKKLRTTTAFFNTNGTISLKNDFVELGEFSAPVVFPVTRSDDQFLYDRNESGFEDVNVLYHLTNHKTHLDALGFSSLPGYVINVDPHALGGDDNSAFFTGATPYRLLFGEGGVDDAEDADVVVHEYTHAYVFAASNNNSGIVERECIEESLGDYFAASYSRSISAFNKEQVYSWDGHNEFWIGREVESTKDYKQVNFVFDIYEHTDLWASPLMEAYGILGRNAMDQIVMESIYSLGSNTTFRDMAIHVIEADYALNNGANFEVLKAAFVRRNILEANYVSLNESIVERTNQVQLFGSYEFAQGGELLVESEELMDKMVVYSISGQKVREVLAYGTKKSIELSSYDLKPGVYLIHVQLSNGSSQSFKVSRF
jgi:hypothetical protein